jgi:type I restriction enzyme S subunit
MMGLDILPDGWTICKVGEIADSIQSGFACGAHNREGRGTIHLRPMNITLDGRMTIEDVRYVDSEVPHRVQAGDVLFNNTNSAELVGKTTVIRESTGYGFSNHMTRIRCCAAVDPAFLAAQLNTMFLDGYFQTRCNNHVSQASISTKYLSSEVDVLIPPLAEQRRIVAKIEALQARSRKTREALEAIPPMLKQFRQSVLAAAFRGDLTADWREEHPDVEPASMLLERIREERRKRWEIANPRKQYIEPEPADDRELPELPDGWCWASLTEVTSAVDPICYGVVQPGDDCANGIPLVRVCDIRKGVIQRDKLRSISAEVDAEYARSRLKGREVLVSIVGTIGRVAVVPNVLRGTNIARALARLTTSTFVSPHWLASWLEGSFMQDFLIREACEVARKTLNLKELEQASVPLAPRIEMDRIMSRLPRAMATCDRIAELASETLNEIALLDQSILSKAFRGELVPQDPNDEPASVLLERIRAERAAQGNGRARRPRGSR